MNPEIHHPLGLLPSDESDLRLADLVHPSDWQNPTPKGRYDLVIIGGGPAGLVAAASAAGIGARTALIERHLLGGDCLNVGCVPSKALLAAAAAAQAIRDASHFGISSPPPIVDFAAVMARVRRVRAEMAPHDSAARFRDLGVDVFIGHGQFTAPDRITVAGHSLSFRRALIATGARPDVPPVPGLREVSPLTNENVFNRTTLPRRLAVLGAGPIACELAQAFRRLGSEVTLLARRDVLLARDASEAGDILANRFSKEGIQLHWNALLHRVQRTPAGHLDLEYVYGSRPSRLEVDEILVATGRRPNTEGLGLATAGVALTERGAVAVDDSLRTSNPRIYAAGDVCLEHQFTHAANFAARTVVQNALFPGRKRVSRLNIPHCTYTDPEVAQVGHTLASAQIAGIPVTPFTRHFRDLDRARTDGTTEGFVRMLVRQGTDRIVGATIVGSGAGEMIGEVAVAMAAGMGLGTLGNVIHPYPTLSEALQQCGDAYNRTRLTPTARTWIQRWLGWNRKR